MDHGICVTYNYDGDEAAWRSIITGFVSSVKADADLAGKFTYHVHTAKDGHARIHIGRWDKAETVELLQSRPYFTAFARSLKELAGDSLKATPFAVNEAATP